MPLPGATVLIKGTTTGASTDFDGKYSISANVGDVLTFSYVGYADQSSTIGASNKIDIALALDSSLDEVVIETAYDVKRTKATTNSAVQIVSAETIENRPNTNVIQTLQGQTAGLNITTGSGQPGATSSIIIRGIGSINGSTEPLFIIDGVPSDQTAFRNINSNDVASVSILKDAGATSVYGNRGANGVIIINTKRGKFKSSFKVNYSGSSSIATIQNDSYNLMDSKQQLELERTFGTGRGVGLEDAEIAAIARYANTDWKNEFFREAITQNHTIGITSGSENLNSFTSIGYTDQEGILKGSDLKRFTVRSNINGKTENGKFKYGSNLSLSYTERDVATSIGTGGVNQNFVLGAYNALPYISPTEYDPNNAGVSLFNGFASTPLLLLDKLKYDTNYAEEVRIIGGLNGSYKISDSFTANSRLNIDYSSQVDTYSRDPRSFNSQFFAPGRPNNNTPGYQDQDSFRDARINIVNSINYSRVFNEVHTFNAGAYVEYIKNHYRQFGYRAQGLDVKTFSTGDGSGFVNDNADNDWFVDTANAQYLDSGLFSYFGTLDYDYNKRFGFAGTIRRDATNRFIGDNTWGTFWSVSGRWNIDKESFMQNTAFNMLKLRGSYGTSGNQNINGTSPYNTLNNYLELYGTGGGYEGQNSIFFSQIAYQPISWEVVTQANIGLDFGLYSNKLNGSLDLYNKTTSELFTAQPIQAVSGANTLFQNQGSIINKGVELNLNYKVLQNKNGLNIALSANGAYNNATREDANLSTIEEGGKLNQYYVIKYAGVNPANGNLLYYDINGNVTETPDVDDDRVFTDKNRLPDYQGGFGINVDYKGFFFETQFNYAIGIDRFDFDYSGFVDPGSIGSFRASTDLNNAWTPTNTNTNIPSLTAANINDIGAGQSDRFIQSADYLRMRFVSLGYSFKKDVLKRLKLGNLKVFINGENLVTFSQWNGYDAEGLSTTQADYPTPKIISAGVEIGF
jgi:TonB-linked SusC/RagA family outer membrane protein